MDERLRFVAWCCDNRGVRLHLLRAAQ